MSQVDEGLIHAWLDGQLTPDEAARVEQLVAADAAWGAAAADARGVVAGASRILGALDDVPSVKSVGGAATARRKRSVWREPWLQAAAVLVLTVGVGSYVMQQVPTDASLTTTKEAQPTDSARQRASAENVVALPGVAAAPPSAAASRPAAPAERGSREASKRDEGVAPKTAPRLDSARGGAKALGSVAGAMAASDGAAGAGAKVAATRPVVTGDSGKVNALALQKSVPITLPNAAASAVGGSGGRGGRSANAAAEMRDQLSAAAKSVAEPRIIDPRLSGCWLTTDTMPSRAYVLKFIDPIATDMVRAANAPPVAQSALAPQVAPRALPRAPAGARVENTSPRTFGADSSFRAEWITGNGRTTLVFTIRGDSLAGNTILAAGDIRYPPAPLHATRVQCPP